MGKNLSQAMKSVRKNEMDTSLGGNMLISGSQVLVNLGSSISLMADGQMKLVRM